VQAREAPLGGAPSQSTERTSAPVSALVGQAGHRGGRRGDRAVHGRAGRAEQHRRPAEPQHVAVVQPPAAEHARGVDERPVAREPIVDERPAAAHPFQPRVGARDLRVPAEHHVVVVRAADRDPVAARQRRQAQVAGAVA
jgi:hypothetical protein